ncbi:hypothetical protein O181_007829 [Austropuccinia psidii MF-1]|uniref:Uncharacterized protein n=1 Tax=Austropuccinia psidii MF-1 TaxID=1389203 RepID=A0A9Q3GIA1_9BASI|nr:hypothetical protein [Austropuccinia psidii MF-1]
MEDIIRKFCAYGMEYKYHEGYTHDWITLLPAIQLAYNTSENSTTGRTLSLLKPPIASEYPEEESSKHTPHSQLLS